MKNLNELDWDMMSEDPNRCGGPEDCKGRKYDATKADCQKCMDDLTPKDDY